MNGLKAILRFIRGLKTTSQIDVKRNFTDFFADRIVQAMGQATLLQFLERMAAVLDSDFGVLPHMVLAEGIAAANGEQANQILAYIRKYPRIVAMVCGLKDAMFDDAVASLDASECVAFAQGEAMTAPTYMIPIDVECLAPLSHGSDQKAGNATLFRRGPVLTPNEQMIHLPFYGGNAWRGKMRRLLADDFLRAILPFQKGSSWKAQLSSWFFYALYSGGALEEGSTAEKAMRKEMGKQGDVKPEGLRRFRDMVPYLSLMGCALGNRILPGHIQCSPFWPRCKEWGNGDLQACELFEWQFLTRREDDEGHEDHHGMIATTECLKPGTRLWGGVDHDDAITDIERACLAHGLALLRDFGFLGADNRRGFGKVRISGDFGDDKAYTEYLASHKAEILDYLRGIGAVLKEGGDAPNPVSGQIDLI